MTNIFTVDLEDWFCFEPFEAAVPRSSWHAMEARAHIGTRRLLAILREGNSRATFFVLGFTAQREPALVRDILAEGHEIALHGFGHERLDRIGAVALRDDIRRGSDTLATITGEQPRGYRAPAFSVTTGTSPWVFEVLAELGFAYDSSVFPMGLHPAYGIADAPLQPYRTFRGIVEIPVSCVTIAGVRLPAGGGAYTRQFPFAFTATLARRCVRQGRPFVFYVHPWELDPDHPRVAAPLLTRIRHYRGLRGMDAKIGKLLSIMPFTSVHSYLIDAGFADD
jgi:polysaccharide deacetylase family protein (PEP-CTERM system associated)